MHKNLSNNKYTVKQQSPGLHSFPLWRLPDSSNVLQSSQCWSALQMKEDWEGQPLSNQKKTLLHQYLRHERRKTSSMICKHWGKFSLTLGLPGKIQNAQLTENFIQTMNNFLAQVCPMQYLGHTYTKKKLLVVYLHSNLTVSYIFIC